MPINELSHTQAAGRAEPSLAQLPKAPPTLSVSEPSANREDSMQLDRLRTLTTHAGVSRPSTIRRTRNPKGSQTSSGAFTDGEMDFLIDS